MFARHRNGDSFMRPLINLDVFVRKCLNSLSYPRQIRVCKRQTRKDYRVFASKWIVDTRPTLWVKCKISKKKLHDRAFQKPFESSKNFLVIRQFWIYLNNITRRRLSVLLLVTVGSHKEPSPVLAKTTETSCKILKRITDVTF